MCDIHVVKFSICSSNVCLLQRRDRPFRFKPSVRYKVDHMEFLCLISVADFFMHYWLKRDESDLSDLDLVLSYKVDHIEFLCFLISVAGFLMHYWLKRDEADLLDLDLV